MSFEMGFSKENLNMYLKELAKEFRKLNGTTMPAEIILIGGASILANYGFREMTYDVDAIISASSVMKEAVNRIGDKYGLPNGWLNDDFVKTSSYTQKLIEVSVYYKTYSNILTVRTIAAEYLIAMKLMSGRKYKHDISDIVGILWAHQKEGIPISFVEIDKAVITLYGGWTNITADIKTIIEAALKSGNYEAMYNESLKNEQQSKEILLDFEKNYPDTLKEENIDSILEQAKRKRQKDRGDR